MALETRSNGRPLQLVQVLLEAKQIGALTSRGHPSVFVIKNKLKKWRVLTDLRAVNRVFQPGSPLQPGIPLPSLPVAWPMIIESKDYFLTIPLQEQDKEKLLSQCQHIIMFNL